MVVIIKIAIRFIAQSCEKIVIGLLTSIKSTLDRGTLQKMKEVTNDEAKDTKFNYRVIMVIMQNEKKHCLYFAKRKGAFQEEEGLVHKLMGHNPSFSSGKLHLG